MSGATWLQACAFSLPKHLDKGQADKLLVPPAHLVGQPYDRGARMHRTLLWACPGPGQGASQLTLIRPYLLAVRRVKGFYIA